MESFNLTTRQTETAQIGHQDKIVFLSFPAKLTAQQQAGSDQQNHDPDQYAPCPQTIARMRVIEYLERQPTQRRMFGLDPELVMKPHLVDHSLIATDSTNKLS